MFKVSNNLLHENIEIFFLRNAKCHYKTRSHGKFSYQYVRTNLKCKSVSVIGAFFHKPMLQPMPLLQSVHSVFL